MHIVCGKPSIWTFMNIVCGKSWTFMNIVCGKPWTLINAYSLW